LLHRPINNLSWIYLPPHVYAGAGNAIFPLLAQNRNPELRIHAFDYSSHAVKLVQVIFNRCCVFFSSYQRVDLAKCSVHITALWSDHGCRLGFIVRLSTSRPRAVFRRHTCSRVCPQRLTSFRMAPRHLQHCTGMEAFFFFFFSYPRHHICLSIITHHSDT
jgi:hypothetical protein